MAKKARPARPKDTNQLAKRIADIATGEITEQKIPAPKPAKKKAS